MFCLILQKKNVCSLWPLFTYICGIIFTLVSISGLIIPRINFPEVCAFQKLPYNVHWVKRTQHEYKRSTGN